LTLLKKDPRGRYFPDGILLSNPVAGLSTIPDGLFIRWDTIKKVRIKRVKGWEGYIELVGTPDMTLEVVSRSSTRKDTVLLPELYHQAKIPEYWLVDVRKDPLQFDILRWKREGYVRTPKKLGWVRSRVFGRRFKLIKRQDAMGDPDFVLIIQ
jgi:Uma2 family endonuclease